MYYYIVNPAAGKSAINQIQQKLKNQLKELGIDGEFAKTTGPGDATKMAAAAIAKGVKTIVAVGGDGTVNEVVNGVAKDSVAVGIIPIGSHNHLAKRLGIHSWQQAPAILAQRRITNLSLIAAGQQFFLSNLTIGFESDLDQQNDGGTEGWAAKLKQFQRIRGQAQQFKPLKCLIKTDQFELECQAFTLTVSNQKFSSPLAENKLEISILNKPAKLQLTSYLWRLTGRQGPNEEAATTRFPAERVVINTKPTAGLMIDGKLAGHTPIAIRLTDRRVRFISQKLTGEFRS